MSIESVMPPTISSSVAPSSCLQSFLMSWLFESCGQSMGASASASVLPVNSQGWIPLGLTGLISLQSKGQEFSPAPQSKSIKVSWKDTTFINIQAFYFLLIFIKIQLIGTSLVVKWLRLRLPMQRVWVWSLAGHLRSHMPCGPKMKTLNRSNIVKSSIKTLKNGPHFLKNLKKKKKYSWGTMCVSGIWQNESVLYVCFLFCFQIIFHCRLLQDIEYTSLCYIVGLCWLSITYTVVWIF